MPAYRVAQRVACYVSVNNEVDTKTLIAQTLRDGNAWACPLRGRMGSWIFKR